MPINGSENKSITTNTNSSTDNLGSISINNTPTTINNSINATNNAPLEEYDLSEPMSKEGVLDRNNLDFSRIATTAGNAKDGNFVNVKSPEYWGDNAPLTYKVRDDGTVAISEDGVILGFTDLEGIRIKEADSSKEEQIITEDTSSTTSENTEEVTEIAQNLEEQGEGTTVETIETEEANEETEIKEGTEEVIVENKEGIAETAIENKEIIEDEVEALESEAIVEPVTESQPNVVTPPSGNETNANTVTIPGNVPQSGICGNYTNYSYYYGKWNKGSQQEVISEMWNEAGRPNNNGIAMLNGRYLVAVQSIFGTNGDIIDVYLEDGTIIPCIIGDAKGDDATNTYGHVLGGGLVDVIEWESYGSKADIILGDWEGKNVTQIINKGSIFTN